MFYFGIFNALLALQLIKMTNLQSIAFVCFNIDSVGQSLNQKYKQS